MTSETFSRINSIIERDRTDTPYKYSLLRSVIETCQEYPQHAKIGEGEYEEKVILPMGLLVFKWILYYYPFFEGDFIALKMGEKPDRQNLAFRDKFQSLTNYYVDKGGFSVFYDDFMSGTIPKGVSQVLASLINTINRTIMDLPMRHLGYSLSQKHYSVFTIIEQGVPIRKSMQIEPALLIGMCGRFSISLDLYTVFRDLGGFILGSGCISQKWLEFLVQANKNYDVSEGEIMKLLSTEPTSERNVTTATTYYRKHASSLSCVWSGRPLTVSTLAVDHLLPFAVWKNNDLWNLIPTNSGVNGRKSDKIPTVAMLTARKEEILGCWRVFHSLYQSRFEKEISLGLLGDEFKEGWEDKAFERLCGISEYLIDVRGCEGFEL